MITETIIMLCNEIEKKEKELERLKLELASAEEELKKLGI